MRSKKRLIESILWLGMMLLFNGILSARTIIVDASGNGDYLTITEGMAAANSGDTVYVMPGTYYEHGIRMKENVVLQGAGADKCVIDGGKEHLGWPDNFVIYCDSITNGKIDGFTIKYSKGGGIGCLESLPIITNNKIIDCLSRGILCLFHYPKVQHPVINGNTITRNGTGLYYIVEGFDYSTVDTLDVSFNWWGTTVESEIQAGIRDFNPGNVRFYKVIYKPWLSTPVTSVKTPEAGIHQNNIYGNKEKNVCIAIISGPIE